VPLATPAEAFAMGNYIFEDADGVWSLKKPPPEAF